MSALLAHNRLLRVDRESRLSGRFRKSVIYEIRKLGRYEWIKVGQDHDYVTVLREDPQVSAHAGRASVMPNPARSGTLVVEAISIVHAFRLDFSFDQKRGVPSVE
jgi:hypothetical protein